jgi:hypothetical protein
MVWTKHHARFSTQLVGTTQAPIPIPCDKRISFNPLFWIHELETLQCRSLLPELIAVAKRELDRQAHRPPQEAAGGLREIALQRHGRRDKHLSCVFVLISGVVRPMDLYIELSA